MLPHLDDIFITHAYPGHMDIMYIESIPSFPDVCITISADAKSVLHEQELQTLVSMS
jgi:hypothetical protein